MKNQSTFKLLLTILFISSITLLQFCSKKDDDTPPTPTASLPTLSTSAISEVTVNTAVSGGNVSSDGNATVTARGVCWSLTQTPTISNNKTSNGIGKGSFICNITDLTANTTYYVRAYATNSEGTAYGTQKQFTTAVEVDFLDLSLITINFTTEKDASLVVVQTNTLWTATENADWLSLTSYSGNKSTGFIIGATTNNTFAREAIVTIKAGDKTKEINVTQAGSSQINIIVNDISVDMILVEGGSYIMGDNTYGYMHKVTLNDFYISKTEVTNGLWKAIQGNLPYDGVGAYEGQDQDSKPNQPVSATIWNTIVNDFIPALNLKSEYTFRLPTEAEWEYAAKGGQKSEDYQYAGSNDLYSVGWFDDNSGNTKHDVAQKAPNELGIYDMSGNVNEWCGDWYARYYDFVMDENQSWIIPENSENPTGPISGTERVVRNGDFTTPIYMGSCMIAFRYSIVPSGYDGCWGNTGSPDEPICLKSTYTGFRLVIVKN